MTVRRRLSWLLVVSPALLLAACSESLAPRTGAWVQVVAGDRFTCGLGQDARAWCWGANTFGQLGNHATLGQSAPVAVAGDLTFRSLAAGDFHVCGVATDGSGWCWGQDDWGQLGADTRRCNPGVPILCSSVPLAAAGSLQLDSIVLAGYATCALAQSGLVWCWGLNDHGQLGNGSDVGAVAEAPTAVSGGQLFRAVSLDVNHACGMTRAGGMYCWGSNDFGQLAADTQLTPRCGVGFFCAVSPVAAAPGLTLASVSAGSTHTCAVAPGGAAWCWGSNEYGVLGDPAAAGGSAPVRVTGNIVFTQISAGADHSCGLDAAGAAWCWGLDTFGQLGGVAGGQCPAFGDAQPCATQPIAVAGVPALVSISAGSAHTCGLTLSGDIWCWGRGSEGQLGNGAGMTSMAPVRVVHP